MDQNQLKPCPFCGGSAELKHLGEHFGASCADWKCQGMQGALMHRAAVSAVAAWNRRAALASDAAGAPIPRVHGVSRMADNRCAVLVVLKAEPSDDALRAIHDRLAAPVAPAAVAPLSDTLLEETAEEIMKGMRAIGTWEPRKRFAVRVMRDRLAAAPTPTVAADAAEPINLEGLRKKLLTPRKILRDENGWLTHPDYPVCDEGTRADKFLEAFGIETRFRSMESDLPDFAERWHEDGLTDCSEWTPTPPEGDGWLLLEIYDTEDGPYAMFGRDKYEAENALKRRRTRELSERIQQRQAAQGDEQ